MNPTTWPRRHLLALALAIAAGGALGVAFGYLAHAAGSGASGAYSFGSWAFGYGRNTLRAAALWWGLFGAAIGGTAVYVRQLLR